MRIFLFTNNDNPHADDADALGKCFLHAKTLAEKNIEIELFPLASSEKRFDIRKFYAKIITFDLDEVNDSLVDTSDKILDLQHRLR
jgi:ATP-dependent DNA helicase 2 subunit 1